MSTPAAEKRPIATISADASLLITLFSCQQPGETVTYQQMADAIGRRVENNRGVMTTVRTRLLADYGMVLTAVPRVGYLIADDALKVTGIASQARRRIHKIARRTRKELLSVTYDRLSDEHKKRYFREMSLSATMEAVTTDRASKRLEDFAKPESPHLAIAATLDALRGG